jgi:mono/diheme cytochrome c family protein
MKKSIVLAGIALSAIILFSFDQSFDMKASMERGKTLYENNCQSCHMAEGEGLEGVLPPLAKSENLADKNRLVKVILLGMRGSIKVRGVEYNGEMTGGPYTDEQVSDILNYIRNSWGNKGAAIGPQEIQAALKSPSKGYIQY